MAEILTINIGSAPDDETGDPLRNAFDKINANDNALNSELATKGTLFTVNVLDLPTVVANFRGVGLETLVAAFAAVGGSGSFPVADTTTIVKDPDDATKLMRFDIGGLSTATTAILTLDRSVDFGIGGTFPELANVEALEEAVTNLQALPTPETYLQSLEGYADDVTLTLRANLTWGPATGVLENESISATTHQPANAKRYTYTSATGAKIVFASAFAANGEGQVIKESGAGTMQAFPANGLTINGSDHESTTPTALTDFAITSASGATCTFGSSADFVDYAEGDVLKLADHASAGVYLVGATSTTSSIAVTRIDGGTNPVNATATTASLVKLTPLELKSIASVWRISNDFTINDGTSADKDLDGSNLTGIANLTMTGNLDVGGTTELNGATSVLAAITLGSAGSISDAGPINATGSLTKATHGGRAVKTTGNVTIPNAAGDVGMGGIIILGGAHTISFNSTTTATLASGDVFTYYVESTTVLKRSLLASADQPAMS